MEMLAKRKTTVDVVVRSWKRCVVIDGVQSDGVHWSYAMDPISAVGLYRCCIGELSSTSVALPGRESLSLVFKPEREEWELSSGDTVAIMDADRLLVLGWSLKACVTSLLIDHRSTLCMTARDSVWVLSSRRILTGDSAAEGVDLVGGSDAVYSSRETAMTAVREFMRPMVNAANTEMFWEKSDTSVDDELDAIMDGQKRIGDETFVWCYDGEKQSFEVVLSKHPVDPESNEET